MQGAGRGAGSRSSPRARCSLPRAASSALSVARQRPPPPGPRPLLDPPVARPAHLGPRPAPRPIPRAARRLSAAPPLTLRWAQPRLPASLAGAGRPPPPAAAGARKCLPRAGLGLGEGHRDHRELGRVGGIAQVKGGSLRFYSARTFPAPLCLSLAGSQSTQRPLLHVS